MSVVAPQAHNDHPARWVHDADLAPLPRQREDDDGSGRPVQYGAFDDPWCYLASQRGDLIADPNQRPDWRMVDTQAAPGTRLSAAGTRCGPDDVVRRQAELDAVRALLRPGEHLPAHPPAIAPHTGPAVVGYAEAVGAGVGDDVRRLLFDAYWERGADIGLPEVLRRLLQAPLQAGTSTVHALHEHGYAVTLTGGPMTSGAHHRLARWHAAWIARGAGLTSVVPHQTAVALAPAPVS